MKVTCLRTKGHPIVIHAPGFTASDDGKARWYFKHNPAWPPLLRRWERSRPSTGTHAGKVTVLTVNTRSSKGLLEQSLDRMGFPYIVVGKHVTEWKNRLKLQLFAEALREIHTPYVMGLDSYDVLMLDSPDIAVDRFEQLGCEMLFNGEKAFYPWFGPKDKNGGEYITETWKRFQEAHGRGDFRYLNAGAWIAKTEFCREFFSAAQSRNVGALVEKGELPVRGEGLHQLTADGEQIVMQWLFSDFHPRIQIDYDNRIFLAMTGVNWWSELSLFDGPWQMGPIDWWALARSGALVAWRSLRDVSRPLRGKLGLRRSQW